MLRILRIKTFWNPSQVKSPLLFGPFNFASQRRWKKPANTAQTRLEGRTRDLKLDRLVSRLRNLKIAIQLFDLMSNRRGPYVSVQIMSRWANLVGLRIGMGDFLHKYPHVFELFTHPVKRNLCCRVTNEMLDLIGEEECVIRDCESENVRRLKKLLMMSKNGTLHLHALRLTRRELGLPEDFRESIIEKHPEDFELVDAEIVGLVARDDSMGIAEVEKWREKEYTEKWLSEYETRFAFPIHFPTGFKIEKGFKEKLNNWQRLPYAKPYETQITRSRTKSGVKQFEKTVVGILHEFLNLTVEKTIEVERFAHFRRDLGMDVNIRELLLAHPGIFYVSTKGNYQTVFLREAYSTGCLVELNQIHNVRSKMLDLMLLGCRDTKVKKPGEIVEEKTSPARVMSGVCARNGEWAIPLLEGCCN